MQTLQSSRRRFLQKMSLGIAGAAALGELQPVREVFARQLSTISPEKQPLAAMRTAYSLAPYITYFNHGSIGTIPKIVLQAYQQYLALCESNPHLYMWGEPWQAAREVTRQKAADYLGCDENEIAFTHNTTEGFNLLASGLPLQAGDEVVFSSMNHAGASICWQRYARQKGFTAKRFTFPIREVPALSEQDVVDIYAKNITAKTKVLVFPHIDNLVGLRYPVRKMAEMARAKGVDYIAVDGAQAVGMIPVSLHELGVDFYATSPHKWLQAPKGTGLLYVRKEMQAMLEPMWVTWGQQRWHTSARKYEDYGTRNLATVLALGDAIDWQHKLDSSGKQQRLQKLRAYFLQKTEATPMCSWRSPRKWQQGCSLYTIELQGEKSTELSQRLYQIHGVVFRPFSGENWNTLRVSLNFYNTEAEIDRFFALARL